MASYAGGTRATVGMSTALIDDYPFIVILALSGRISHLPVVKQARPDVSDVNAVRTAPYAGRMRNMTGRSVMGTGCPERTGAVRPSR